MAEWQFARLTRMDGRVVTVLASAWQPRGWCPVHYSTGNGCTAYCVDARAELAAIQREYDALWTGEIAA